MGDRAGRAEAGWTTDEVETIAAVDEVRVASRRIDGSLRPFVTIWAVQAGDDIYVRSARGPTNGWFRRAVASGAGRVRAGSVERDVSFVRTEGPVNSDIDRAYHAKYDRYGPSVVGTVVNPEATQTTLRLVPR
jgi:hypothetical protein